jgi:hypothetical protein
MGGKVLFNGREYGSVDEMPADVRQAYLALQAAFVDLDGDGLPDIFQGRARINVDVTSETQIIFDGHRYSSADELPAEARQRYDQAMAALAAARPAPEPPGLRSGSAATPPPAACRTRNVAWLVFVAIAAVVIIALVAALVLGAPRP